MEHAKFRIDGTTIDMGTDGKYGPGSEDRLAAKLKEKGKEGERLFNSLVDRGAIVLVNDTPEPPEVEREVESDSKKKSGATSSKDGDPVETGETEDDPPTEDPEEETPDYSPTGRYEYDHYAGGHCNIIDPNGFKLEHVRGVDKAKAKVEELNQQHEL